MTDDGRDDRNDRGEIAMRQFRTFRCRERENMLNHTKVERRARSAGLTELADAVEEGWYYDLFDRYHAGIRSEGETDG